MPDSWAVAILSPTLTKSLPSTSNHPRTHGDDRNKLSRPRENQHPPVGRRELQNYSEMTIEVIDKFSEPDRLEYLVCGRVGLSERIVDHDQVDTDLQKWKTIRRNLVFANGAVSISSTQRFMSDNQSTSKPSASS